MTRRRERGEVIGSVFDRLDAVMQRFIDQGKVAGAVYLIGRRDETLHLRARGVMDLATRTPMRPDAIFRIASLTEPIIATAVMMLVEAGRLALEEPVSTSLPALAGMSVLVDPENPDRDREPLRRPITVAHLLTHTGGFAHGIYPGELVETLYRKAGILDPRMSLRLAQPLVVLPQRIAGLPLVAQPGTVWRHGLGYDLLGALVEEVSGLSLPRFLRERLFQPLGMVDTAFVVPRQVADRLPVLHGGPNGRLGLTIDGRADSVFCDPAAVPSGGRGLTATVQDLARFLRMLINGGELDGRRYLTTETTEAMICNQLTPSMLPIEVGALRLHGMGYGLGFSVCLDPGRWPGGGSCGTGWWLGNTGTLAWFDRRADLIGLYLTQTMGYHDPGIVFQNQVYHTLGLDRRSWSGAISARRRRWYAGSERLLVGSKAPASAITTAGSIPRGTG